MSEWLIIDVSCGSQLIRRLGAELATHPGVPPCDVIRLHDGKGRTWWWDIPLELLSVDDEESAFD